MKKYGNLGEGEVQTALFSEHFESLTDEQAEEFSEKFMAPEYFVRTAHGIAVVK